MRAVRTPGSVRTAAGTGLALLAFAGNSLLCRLALAPGTTDPATFTAVRLAAGAVVLALLVGRSSAAPAPPGAAARALALFGYAALFSWAYVRIPAGVGALVLFACVQLTMLGWACRTGTGPRGVQWVGVALAIGGLAWLLLPGASAPDLLGTALMAASGAAWGAYTLLGRGAGPPLPTTARAFAWGTAPAVLVLGLAWADGAARASATGLLHAALSGAVTSGLAYAVWYAVLPRLGTTRAAALQLAVPVLAALGAVSLLGEPASDRLALAGAAVLLGIGLTLRRP